MTRAEQDLPGSPPRSRSPRRTGLLRGLGSAVVIAVAGVVGHVLGASELDTAVGELLIWGLTCVGLALAVVIGQLWVHPWWGAALAWGSFMVGVVPPLSAQDALWAVAAFILALLAAGYIAVLNSIVLEVRRRRHRRR